MKVRSDLSHYLYEDVKPCFEFLQGQGLKIGIMTNGNARLFECELFRHYLSVGLGANDVGATKPSPVAFIACAQKLNIPAARILYVGDAYENDVIGPKFVGMDAALLLRSDINSVEVKNENIHLDEATLHKYKSANFILNSLFSDHLTERIC